MEYLEFILYGLIQGATEFIPVSSTAHLKIISLMLGVDDPGTSISAIIQIGSVIALIWYFRREICYSNFFKTISDNDYYSRHKLFSYIHRNDPNSFFGWIYKAIYSLFFNTYFRSNISIGIMSLLMAFLMYFADNSKNRILDLNNHSFLSSLSIGFAQALAIIPGVSRSGITISTALLLGWKRRDAAKYSFLLGLPAISLAALVEFAFSFKQISTINFFPLLIGVITTFISSLLAIKFVVSYLSSHGLKLFVYYRIVFGILILLNL